MASAVLSIARGAPRPRSHQAPLLWRGLAPFYQNRVVSFHTLQERTQVRFPAAPRLATLKFFATRARYETSDHHANGAPSRALRPDDRSPNCTSGFARSARRRRSSSCLRPRRHAATAAWSAHSRLLYKRWGQHPSAKSANRSIKRLLRIWPFRGGLCNNSRGGTPSLPPGHPWLHGLGRPRHGCLVLTLQERRGTLQVHPVQSIESCPTAAPNCNVATWSGPWASGE